MIAVARQRGNKNDQSTSWHRGSCGIRALVRQDALGAGPRQQSGFCLRPSKQVVASNKIGDLSGRIRSHNDCVDMSEWVCVCAMLFGSSFAVAVQPVQPIEIQIKRIASLLKTSSFLAVIYGECMRLFNSLTHSIAQFSPWIWQACDGLWKL